MTVPIQVPEQTRELLDRWQQEGLLSASDAQRIAAAEAARAARQAPPPPAPPARPPAPDTSRGIVAEALGYVGAALIIAAVVVLAGQTWADLPLAVRAGTSAVVAILLLLLGVRVPGAAASPASRRLQAVLWTGSAAMVMGTLALIAADGLDWRGEDVVLWAGAVTSVYVAVLWSRARVPVLHIAQLVVLAATVAAAGEHLSVLEHQGAGLAVWALGVGWVVASHFGAIAPTQLGYAAGSLAAIIGIQTTMPDTWGSVLAVATAGAIVALAVWQRSMALLVIGTYALLSTLPAATQQLFHGARSVALGLFIAGMVLVLSAMRILRHDEAPTRRP